ncbi:uncharacterized protein BT62DRAFT_1076633 [Guyanagaster necrorhizus]|uniref:VWFA domain-containing protein n=1 Tax=Guyanagaster necrorhizus TaxID=856835 RepID=A0A9P7VRW9_9AGAR|nr:uncharacterized protein BT62DRAFT_1076633 [Guyanagaster necrorhizus MCA 3950]KAG7445538.1 hypothetical protein BT62DRAFT_1076633 [Guyanagaster necrorhizus MCA 3950]
MIVTGTFEEKSSDLRGLDGFLQFCLVWQPEKRLNLPRNASAPCTLGICVQSSLKNQNCINFRHGLTDIGDGMRRGSLLDYLDDCTGRVSQTQADPYKLEIQTWSWRPTAERRAKEESKHLTRLRVFKELVNHLLNRAASFDTPGLACPEAYHHSSHLVSDTVGIKQELTPIFENFRRQLEDVDAKGDTYLYDAIDTARSTLVDYRKDFPSLRKRIIVLSDGDDNKSVSTARDVAIALQKDQVVVDSIQVGICSNTTLHAISVTTNGYRFAPQSSLGDALSIFDLETMLSSIERSPKTAPPQIHGIWDWNVLGNFSLCPIDVVTIDCFPKQADHSKLNENVQQASKSMHLKEIVRGPHTNIDVYVNGSDASFFKLILEVSKDTENCVYAGGTFLLTWSEDGGSFALHATNAIRNHASKT